MKPNFLPIIAVVYFLVMITSYHQVHCLKESLEYPTVGESGKESLFPALDVIVTANLRGKNEDFSSNFMHSGNVTFSSEDASTFERSLSSSVSPSMQQMLNFVNTERKKRGRSDLCFNNKLVLAAQSHNNDMIQKDYFSHSGADGSSLGTRVNRVNYSWRRVGENIAINSSVQRAHTSLMNSPGHKKNILDGDYDQIGLGLATQTSGKWKGFLYVTQVFGTSNSESCSSGSGGSRVCNNEPSDWYDSDGKKYNCNWYGADPRHCQYYGSDYRNFGKTANEACCTCGGGSK